MGLLKGLAGFVKSATQKPMIAGVRKNVIKPKAINMMKPVPGIEPGKRRESSLSRGALSMAHHSNMPDLRPKSEKAMLKPTTKAGIPVAPPAAPAKEPSYAEMVKRARALDAASGYSKKKNSGAAKLQSEREKEKAFKLEMRDERRASKNKKK